MTAAIQERFEFAPPPTPGMLRAFVLAILAHGVLLAVLTLGVQWKREATPITVEAELWSSVPVQAAPPAPKEAAQPEPPKPAEPKPEPRPEPVVAPKPVPQIDPAIALAKEKEKARLLKEKEKEKQQQEKLALDKKKQEKLAQEKALKEKELQAKVAADKLAKDKAAKRSADEAKALQADRDKTLKRMMDMAGSGGTGEAGSTGTAMKSAAPSVNYAGRVVGKIKPNITFTDAISGNPRALVEIRTSPDGTIIVGKLKLLQSSGVKAWDDAVLNAILKTEVLPKDVDGRVPPVLEIGFRPKD
ncbi:MAG: cell envelope integrity protein TolA [Burkholderiales bacterium]|nr:cell envelope integrity protein TolA [Burkholderiales bacterium]